MESFVEILGCLAHWDLLSQLLEAHYLKESSKTGSKSRSRSIRSIYGRAVSVV